MKRRKKPIKKKLSRLNLIILTIVLIILSFSILFKSIETTHDQKITIHSPLNKTYSTKNIILNVSTNEVADWFANSFDNGKQIIECYGCTGYARYDLIFESGIHTIRIYASINNTQYSASVSFTVI